jgi:SAM-dependent methyltransferase
MVVFGLNLGSGDHADISAACDPTWLNLDKFNMPHWPRPPDVLADVLDGLPFSDATFCRAYLGHVAEHFEYDSELQLALREIRRVLKPGGELMVVGPCYDKAVTLNQPEWLLSIIRPPAEYIQPRGIEHRWLPTTKATLAAVQKVFPGAVEISVGTVRPPRWPNASLAGWQCAVLANNMS